jgi:hypothetical protein
MAWLVAGPAVLQFIITFMPLPASIGILISEAFAIRSWIFHVFNGIVTAWLGCQFYVTVAGMHMPLLERPLILTAAGIVAGFAYWAVAGFNAGFYKPLFRHDPSPSLPATTR